MRNPENRNHERREAERLKDLLLGRLETAREEREEIIGTSVAVLESGDEDARWMAVGVLAETGDERVVQPLIEALRSDPSPRVRAEAARVLGDWRDLEKPFYGLVEAAGDRSEFVRVSAFEALRGMDLLEAEPGMYESLDRRCAARVEKTDDPRGVTRFEFLVRKDGKPRKLGRKAFVIICPDGHVEGETDSRGRALVADEDLRKAGCRGDAPRIRFVLR